MRASSRSMERMDPLVKRPVRAVYAVAALFFTLLTAASCGGQGTSGGYGVPGGGGETSGDQRYPDVREAEPEPDGGGTYSLSVTISSPYDSPDRYADGWRVLGPDGTVLGEHELMHDHADEQPFTRTQTGLEIPEGTGEITVEGRDLENGYGGDTVTVPVEGGQEG